MKRAIKAFTLIELLTVIAIIGILAAIIIPTVGVVKVKANNARTKAMFSQWTLAMDLFKGEYGFYPAIGSTTSTGASTKKVVPTSFFIALTGKTYAGKDIPSTADNFGNKRRLSFYTPNASDVTVVGSTPFLNDAFGNTDFAVFSDINGDGIVNSNDSGNILSYQPVSTPDGTVITPTTANFNTTEGVRAGVIFYSAGKGASAKDIVTSWQ